MRIEAFLCALLIPALGWAGEVAEPEGYRMDAFRAPVPATLAGAEVIDTTRARALWESGDAVFVDVFPRPPKPANLPEDTLWIDKPRDTIPGTYWLPNTGYGALSEAALGYLTEGLMAASGGDPAAALVIFCQRECWMSWNAAKRAMVELGYTTVLWYPDGLDGWGEAGLPLETMQPWDD